MYTIHDLFDQRNAVGSKLEKIFAEKSYTKSQVCKETGISRPTLDKILSGSLSNKTNYEKHLTKILSYLSLTPDILLGNIRYPYIRAKNMRRMLRVSSERISQATNISLERLQAIESGESATLAELRDLAFCFGTSVRGLLGTGIFPAQISTMDLILQTDAESAQRDISGFWGHLGILASNMDKYLWFPITRNTRKSIYHDSQNNYIVVPCMNNKVLLLNMKYINELILLDDACDEPSFANWDYHVDCGEIPPVVYEVLEDYWYEAGYSSSEDSISSNLRLILDALTTEKQWDEDSLYELTTLSTLYFKDGHTRPVEIDFHCDENVSSTLSILYDFDETDPPESMLLFQDTNGAEIMVKLDNISIMELPLHKVEEAICAEWDL